MTYPNDFKLDAITIAVFVKIPDCLGDALLDRAENNCAVLLGNQMGVGQEDYAVDEKSEAQ